MKKIIFMFCAAAMLAVACNKEPVSKAGEGKPVEVSINIQGTPGTRATGVSYADDEGLVNNVQVWIFKDGQKETYKPSSALSVSVAATSGERSVWAVLNAPDLSSIATESALKQAVTALSENSRGNFVMSGNVTLELTDGVTVPVPVRRYVARVSIGKISTAFAAGSYRENFKVKVNSIYLINVPGNNSYDLTAGPALWVNQLAHNSAAYDALLFDALDNIVVDNANSYTMEHVFYPYPNPYGTDGTNNFDDAWSPRGSLLVLDVIMYEADGTTVYKEGYYPIALPVIQRNKTYIIDEVVLTRIPGDVPYKPIETGESTVNINVLDWEVGLKLGVNGVVTI